MYMLNSMYSFLFIINYKKKIQIQDEVRIFLNNNLHGDFYLNLNF